MSVTSHKKSTEEKSGRSAFLETLNVMVQALLIALVVRTVLFQPFSIPSGSMKDTLLVGDYLFVSKYSYGYSRYSIPFAPPLFEGRLFAAPPQRGDIAVFKLPSDNETDYIKRVIGLPGDRIQMVDGVLTINGTPVPREQISDFEETDISGRTVRIARYRETLPNGVTYTTLDLVEGGFYDNTPVYEVPDGHYFMMGDNRDNSTDSRVLSAVGYVPEVNLIGKAQVVFFSIQEGAQPWAFWQWPQTVRWSRLFETLQ